MGIERRFHLNRFQPDTTNLDLFVTASEVHQPMIVLKPNQISGAVEPLPVDLHKRAELSIGVGVRAVLGVG